MNQYFADMVRNGGALNWTDAIDRLSDYLKRVPASNVAAIDWGIVDSLRLLNHGKLPLRILELSSSEPSPTEVQDMGRFLAVPGIVFVAHAPGREFHAGSDAKLLKFAESTGYQRQILAVLEDSWRRPTFEVYRFVHEH
jgi:hypothetical protein